MSNDKTGILWVPGFAELIGIREDGASVYFGSDTPITVTSLQNVAGEFDQFVPASGKVLTVSNTLTLAGTDSTVMTFPSTSASVARIDAAQSFTGLQTFADLQLTATSASTDGGTSVEPFNVDTTLTGVGGVGGRGKFTLTTNVALGSWSNALKAEVTYGASGRTTGLGSAFVAEMTLSAGTSAGNYALYEGELNLGSGALTGTATSLMYFSINGADAATFDTSGYLMNIQGATGAEDKFFDSAAEITNVNEITGGLRIKIGASDYYILLATAADTADA